MLGVELGGEKAPVLEPFKVNGNRATSEDQQVQLADIILVLTIKKTAT